MELASELLPIKSSACVKRSAASRYCDKDQRRRIKVSRCDENEPFVVRDSQELI